MTADAHASSRRGVVPGGDLVSALFDRQLMALADRGGASGMIGQRWADLCALHVAEWIGGESPVPQSESGHCVLEVVRLDADPAIAEAASRRGLQNPDYVIAGTHQGLPALQAADAKFSIETARSRQVSAEVLGNLFEVPRFANLMGPWNGGRASLLPGVFLSPDYPLTTLMLNGRRGITRTTVTAEEVVRVRVDPAEMLAGLEGGFLTTYLERIDALPERSETSLTAMLYYFRLVRAAAGCWWEEHRPLLGSKAALHIDLEELESSLAERTRHATSAFELVMTWETDVERVRRQRQAVEQVAGLPLPNRDLRDLVERLAQSVGCEPPSVNQVRRRLGAWYRAELRARVGDLCPPVTDLGEALGDVRRASRELRPQLEAQAAAIVLAMIAEKASSTAGG